jgi:hypothetical protein
MLCILTEVKDRLGLLASGSLYDAVLTLVINATEQRFVKECGRFFTFAPEYKQIYRAGQTAIALDVPPFVAAAQFEVRQNGVWQAVTAPPLMPTSSTAGILNLDHPVGSLREHARITYTGGYWTPTMTGSCPPGVETLPDDLRMACVEQVAAWWQWRDKVDTRAWEDQNTGQYRTAADMVWVPWVKQLLRRYRRVSYLG